MPLACVESSSCRRRRCRCLLSLKSSWVSSVLVCRRPSSFWPKHERPAPTVHLSYSLWSYFVLRRASWAWPMWADVEACNLSPCERLWWTSLGRCGSCVTCVRTRALNARATPSCKSCKRQADGAGDQEAPPMMFPARCHAVENAWRRATRARNRGTMR